MRRLFALVFGLLAGTASAGAQSLAELTSRGTSLPLVTPAYVACTDQPVVGNPSTPLRVLSGQAADPHQAFAAGEVVVLSGRTGQKLEPGQRFMVRRVQPGRQMLPAMRDAPSAVRTAGWLTVVASDEHFALARIDFACDAILAGDYLDTFVEPTAALASAASGPPRFEQLATVVFGVDRRENFGAGDIFSIDQGTADGVQAGTRVTIFRDRRIGTPLVEVGEGHVVDVAPRSARVVVTRARDAIRRGDLVVFP